MNAHPHIIVVGAGAFGGWSALTLLRRGARVTLVDATAPGHPASSSGGHTRIIRATYGARRIYVGMAARAMRRWQEEEALWKHGCLQAGGALWMSGEDDRFAQESAAALRDEGLPVEELDPGTAARRWPQISFDGISSVLFEPEAGVLFAQRACQRVAEHFVASGGTYRTAAVLPPESTTTCQVQLADGTALTGDAVVFACGPWLGHLFPDVIGALVTPTRQVIHYFEPPADTQVFAHPTLPVWLELGSHVMYGIADCEGRGFKIGDDTSGPVMDPTLDSRIVAPHDVEAVRAFVARRFPLMADARWLGGEVCQYEATPDSHFIIDTHPHNERMWLVGGGSGHGFKMGPVIGDIVADAVLGRTGPDPAFSLHRFANGRRPAGRKW